MFNLLTRTPNGSGALGSFAIGIGYSIGTFGPLLGGWLFAGTGSWTATLWLYVATFIPMTIGAVIMVKPNRFLEDQINPKESPREI